MATHKHAFSTWTLADTLLSWDEVQVALLMDIRSVLYQIRDHTQATRGTLQCGNAQAIPDILRRIEKNTKRRKRRKTNGRR